MGGLEMRGKLPAGVLLLGLVGACGRIGYGTVSDFGDSGATGVAGTGGVGPTTGLAGAAGGRGGSGGAAGAGGGPGSAGTGGALGAAGTGGPGGTTGQAGTIGRAGTTGLAGTTGQAGTTGRGGTGGTVSAPCPTASFNGHDYALCQTPLSWADAADDCVARGMHLVRIDDLLENAFLQVAAFATAVIPSPDDSPWIGANDRAVDGDWRWADGALFWRGAANGSVLGGLFEHWGLGSPAAGANDCAVFQLTGAWTDWDCTRLQHYVCEQ